MPTELDDYLFDLNGYLLLEGVLDREHIADLNASTDELMTLERGGLRGKL